MPRKTTPAATQRAIDAIVSAPVTDEPTIDYGYAESDATSVWIERTGEKEFV